MNGLVIGNGKIENYKSVIKKLKDEEFNCVICCDGGVRHLGGLGIKPDIIVGDMDSSKKSIIDFYKDKCEIEVYSDEKDYTDGELGIKKAIEMGCDCVTFIGSTGNRLDHTLANLNLSIYAKSNDCELKIVDEKNIVYLLNKNLNLKNLKGSICSIVPITLEIKEVYTKGFKYPIKGESIYIGETKSISNVIIENDAVITMKQGIAYVIISED